MLIHKEGYRILLIVFLVLAVLNILVFNILSPALFFKIFSLAGSTILFLFILFFFREPYREITPDDNLIYSPADGKIVVIEEVEEPEYFKDKRIQVSIFMSPLDVHINHYSMGGVIKYKTYSPGKHLVAYHPKSSVYNERSTLVIDNEKGCEVMIRQIAGILARRIVNYATIEDRVNQGDQLGFIKFGSRVDIFLPLDANLKVDLNQPVKGKKTILAEI